MIFIESDRLKLIPLKHHQLLLFDQHWDELQRTLGLNTSSMVVDDEVKADMAEALYHFWLPNTHAYPDLYYWYTNWLIILKNINVTVGGIGFNGYPDDYGETSVGYMIDEQHRGNNYATEAVNAICKWGFDFSILKNVKADTGINNLASQRVLTKSGFRKLEQRNKSVFYILNKAVGNSTIHK
ncbi:GNAT family N-acetyltransferase [Mucilaginibacter sp. CSA2-8R]|uniref:GNAT family N-acetyltransferase n=1 Tax=Mucilaginibacter sp. CSA2-8R TaxID=3141542 RepID=UPI00315C8BB6